MASPGANPDITVDDGHLQNNCSYFAHVENHLYQYVALFRLIKELAESEAAREEFWEGFKTSALGHLIAYDINNGAAQTARKDAEKYAERAKEGSWEDTINQLGHDWFGYSLPWAKEGNPKAYNEHLSKAYEERAKIYQEHADIELALAKGKLKEYFVSLWNEIKRRWTECGVLYAVATTATDAAFFVGELALGAGLTAGAIKLLKSIKFMTHISGVARGVGGAVAETATVTKDTIVTVTAVMGAPGGTMRKIVRNYKAGELKADVEELQSHSGVLQKDPQAPLKEKDGPEGEKKKSNGQKGKLAEAKARQRLANEGYGDIRELRNNSDNGIDLVGRNPETGAVKIVEVKANSASLNDLQSAGGPTYTDLQVNRALNGKGNWQSMPNGMDDTAYEISDWLEGASSKDYEIWKYDVDDAGNTTFRGRADWNWKPGTKPKRLTYRDDSGSVARKAKAIKPPSTGPPDVDNQTSPR
ncbi:hypothetical protein GOZ90_19690 [Agrobacterium vitis]|uniref:Uncharacterized protein n=1 Tax=Agrobacterium vitis TaxID=373 RepID=A0A6L6VJG8_AGRVI|nr:hypothetical protein [Agrobacterium vitis]MUZ74915.1 hypothetical protein [Agrobacterium vitis]MVA19936.1 hypothetical protein [Agrobacterium vitis]